MYECMRLQVCLLCMVVCAGYFHSHIHLLCYFTNVSLERYSFYIYLSTLLMLDCSHALMMYTH